jgi:tripartite-type tricarboxylate transporter receptor subunit TctC
MKRWLLWLAAAFTLAAAGLALAQAWPARAVKIVVPFVAGGTTDVVARLLAQQLAEAWGQPVVVEDRAGAGGNIGADAVAKSPPDGYTLFMTSGSIVTANQHL